jgi:type I pantothenate kinase
MKRCHCRKWKRSICPLSRLLNLYVKAKQRRSRVLEQFLGQSRGKGTYIISIAGSVAGARAPRRASCRHCWSAGRNTRGWSWSPPTAYPNKVLEERGLMRRKGFPNYDIRHLVEFVANIRAGHEKVEAPVYSHLIYDIIPTRRRWWSSRTS